MTVVLGEVVPSFRFRTITGDADDDAFADCGIVANAGFIITEDHHFEVMRGSGYKPQPAASPDAAAGAGFFAGLLSGWKPLLRPEAAPSLPSY